MVGIDQRGPEYLLIVQLTAVAVLLDKAGGRTEVSRAVGAGPVQAEQIMPLVVGQSLERVAPLKLGDDGTEVGPQQLGVDWIEHGSQLGVAGDLADAVDTLEIIGIIKAAVVKGQQRRILQVEYGIAGHQDIDQSYLASVTTAIRNPLETASQRVELCVLAEALFDCFHGWRFDLGWIDSSCGHRWSPQKLIWANEENRRHLPG